MAGASDEFAARVYEQDLVRPHVDRDAVDGWLEAAFMRRKTSSRSGR